MQRPLPVCIGRSLPGEMIPGNLHEYPPRNLESWLALIRRHAIRQVVVTGANTDPLLYRHHARLLEDLRRSLPYAAQLSIHTNGLRAPVCLELLNRYDRVTLSLPSFEPETYRALMGVPGPPDPAALLKKLRVPLKLSCVVTEANAAEIPAYLARSAALGIRRVVLRKLYADSRTWKELLPAEGLAWRRVGDVLVVIRSTICMACR